MSLSSDRPWIGVITNPNSKKNQGSRDRVGALQRIVGGAGIVRQTKSTDEIAGVLDEFQSAGIRYWVTDGGDGSLHWMLNVALQRFGDEGLRRVVGSAVPANGGTIDFVARHAGLKGRAEQILVQLVDRNRQGRLPESVEVPSLVLRGEQILPDGSVKPVLRLGFAAALAGIGNGFFEKYYEAGVTRGSKAIAKIIVKGGTSLVLSNTPIAPFAPAPWIRYGEIMRAAIEAEVEVDGRRLPYRRLTAFHVGAFPINLGDVVKVFTHAKNGALHAMIGELSDVELIKNVPRIFLGKKVIGDGLYDGEARTVKARAVGARRFRPVLDGEILDEMVSLEIGPGPMITIPRLDARKTPAVG